MSDASKQRVWLEMSVYDHWGTQPHGIPRVTQSIFTESLARDDVRYFFYHWGEEKLVAIDDVGYFRDLASGVRKHDDSYWPAGQPLIERLSAGDKILFSGITWYHPLYFDRIAEIKAAHPALFVNYLIHDVIAIKRPHFFTEEFGAMVAQYLRLSSRVVDRYLCDSASTARDVTEVLAPAAETAVIRLGGDIQPPREKRVNEIGRPYVLSTGTIEIRKNHILLYYVWRWLAERLRDACPKLIIVGRPGWLTGDVRYLFEHDPAVRDLVELRYDVDNDRLIDLLDGCLFTVFPAIYEGWGLPACESFYYGKVCVTGNASSLPEINPFPELMFDPYDPRQAFEIILNLIQNTRKLAAFEARIGTEFRRQTWHQCFEEVYQLVSTR